MTYYGAKELAAAFRTVRRNTVAIAEDIPEEQYGFRPTPESRSVAQTLVHIAVYSQLQEQVHFLDRRATLADFNFFEFMGRLIGEEQKPRTKAEIIDLLKSEGDKYASLLDSASEEFLGESVEYPQGMVPPSKSRFEMLMSTKEHEMHHRGQLMLIERLLGKVPPLTREMQARIAAMQAAAKA